jgi:hypothetical protein
MLSARPGSAMARRYDRLSFSHCGRRKKPSFRRQLVLRSGLEIAGVALVQLARREIRTDAWSFTPPDGDTLRSPRTQPPAAY